MSRELRHKKNPAHGAGHEKSMGGFTAAVPVVVEVGIELQSLMTLRQLRGRERRNEIAPLVHRLTTNA
jgi:hypothetical protein